VVIADFGLGEALLTVIEIFFFVIWIWILITILTDLFRDHELSGWAKAGWMLFLVVVPTIIILNLDRLRNLVEALSRLSSGK